MTWFSQTRMIPPPLPPWNRHCYHQWKNGKTDHILPFGEQSVPWKGGGFSCYCLSCGGCSYIPVCQPLFLPVYLSSFFTFIFNLYLTRRAYKTLSSSEHRLPSRDANSSGAAAEPAPSPSGLRQPCSERKTSMQNSHFTRFVIISFSFFSPASFSEMHRKLGFWF